MRRALRDRAPYRRRFSIPSEELIETRYELRVLDGRPVDREELIELLERRFPWFAITFQDHRPYGRAAAGEGKVAGG